MTVSGIVYSVSDGIAKILGLKNCKLGELIYIKNSNKFLSTDSKDTFGLILNLENNSTGAVIFGNAQSVSSGDLVSRSGNILNVSVGYGVLGRVLNGLGFPIDDLGSLRNMIKNYEIEIKAPGILQRQGVKEPLQTGLKCIDTLVPIGRGQRELIIGDRQTGKTAILIDTILNQREVSEKNRPYCIYIGIGQKRSTIAQISKLLVEKNAFSYSVLIAATASEPAPLQFLAPYTGASIGEYFRNIGKHCLIMYDDLSKQAVSYRQVSLLLRRPPGREAFPGDVFYLHSRLLERASKMSTDCGGGSLTALPVIETLGGNLAAYIATNVISITDGQVFLESELFHKAIRPAINVGQSVSRVGSAAQIKALKEIISSLKLELSQYRELASFSQLGSDLDIATQKTLNRGDCLTELLKQSQYIPYTIENILISLNIGMKGFFEYIDLKNILNFEKFIFNYMSNLLLPFKKKLFHLINNNNSLINHALNGLFYYYNKIFLINFNLLFLNIQNQSIKLLLNLK